MRWASLFLLALAAAPSSVLGQCSSKNDCSDGELCAYSAVDGMADLVCCPSGSEVSNYISRNDYGFTSSGRKGFCTGLSDGAKCGEFDNVCSSGSCVLETCQAQKLDDNAVCKIDNDCQSTACAYSAVDGASDFVCCSSGSEVSNYISRNDYGFTSSGRRGFCTGLSDGAKCGEFDNVCASGHCVCGACVEAGFICETGICGPDGCLSEQLQPGAKCIAANNCVLGDCGDDGTCSYLEDSAACSEGLDSQCESQACARDKVAQDAEFVCCPSGSKLTEEGSSLSVCTEMGVTGDSCFSDIICKDNVCVEGTCKGGLQKEAEACEKDGHCHSGTCSGANKCSPFSTLEERNMYFNSLAVCPIASLDNSNSGSSVTLQVFGDSTSRSWSSAYFEEFRDENRDSTGTKNVVEGQKVLDELIGCADGSSIVAQRKGDSVCFSYQFQDVGNDGTDSSCKSKCIKFGGSGSLETYDKLTTRVTGGLFGTPVTAYYFGENRKCRVEVSIEQATTSAENGAGQDDSEGASVLTSEGDNGGGSEPEDVDSGPANGEPGQDENKGTTPGSDADNGGGSKSEEVEEVDDIPASLGLSAGGESSQDDSEGASVLTSDGSNLAGLAMRGLCVGYLLLCVTTCMLGY